MSTTPIAAPTNGHTNLPSQPSQTNLANPLGDRLKTVKEWLENLDNEDKRKIVNALRRSKDAAENGQSSKLKKAKEEFGEDLDFKPILIKTERFGKDRFSLEFIPTTKNPSTISQLWLTPDEALTLSSLIKVERATYAQRIKLAFVYLARKQGIKNHANFRYSTDGEHYTKAYPSLENVPTGEETIGFEQALGIVKNESTKNETEVYQTKVFRVSLSSLEQGNILAFEKCDPEQAPIPRCTYDVRVLKSGNYRNLKRNSEFKLLWPQRQENALFCLMDACQDLILQCSASTLGSGSPYYATIYERHAEIGPDGLLYKGLITCGADKKEASKKASDNIDNIWKGFSSKPRALMCLHSKECHWICQLTEEA